MSRRGLVLALFWLAATPAVAQSPLRGPVAMSADGRMLVVGGWNVEVTVERDGGARETALLVAHDRCERLAVAIDDAGERVLVGDPDAGEARVLVLGPAGWAEETVLRPDREVRGFGTSVTLSGDGRRAFVGAPEAARPGGLASGVVWAFERFEAWSALGALPAREPASGDRIGAALATTPSGDRVAVGAPQDDGAAGDDVGSVTVWTRGAGDWQAEVVFGARAGDRFGSSVAFGGEGLLVGAPRARPDEGHPATGVAVWLVHGDAGWVVREVIEGTEDRGLFGASVALARDGRTAAIGAPSVRGAGLELGGAAYRYVRDGDLWTGAEAMLGEVDGDRLGSFVAAGGERWIASTSPARLSSLDPLEEHGVELGALFGPYSGHWTVRGGRVSGEFTDQHLAFVTAGLEVRALWARTWLVGLSGDFAFAWAGGCGWFSWGSCAPSQEELRLTVDLWPGLRAELFRQLRLGIAVEAAVGPSMAWVMGTRPTRTQGGAMAHLRLVLQAGRFVIALGARTRAHFVTDEPGIDVDLSVQGSLTVGVALF